jgi:predicted metal-dependent HD superfamily phosphohydrolase
MTAAAFPAPLNWTALSETWDRAWLELRRPPPVPVRRELMTAWSERSRHYHDARHLRECLGLLELWAGQGERNAEVSIALWFHDAIYDPGANDNELKSAAWAARVLGEARVPSEVGERVFELIIATQHAAPPASVQSIDSGLLLDIDLAILGAAPERFQAFERDIRKEYAAVPESVYRSARRTVLQGFIAREPLYHTIKARELLDAQARINLQGAFERLAQ